MPSKLTCDEQYSRLRYVRYADDFILSYVGSKQDAIAIKEEIRVFLESMRLKLSDRKTLITHARNERARFLNYEIATKWDDSKLIKDEKGQQPKVRRINGNIGLYVPRDVKLEWVRQYTKKGKPQKVGRLCRSTDFEIVADFGSKLRGLANYYSLAGNIAYEIGQVRWVMMQSMVKTLKRNSNISVRSIYGRYYCLSERTGQKHFRVEIPREDKPPLIATFGEELLKPNPNAYIRDNRSFEYQVRPDRQLVQRLLADKCELCGQQGPTEGHHVKKLSEVKKKYKGRRDPPTWVHWMIRKNRKTIFVCKTCHNDITLGKYDGKKLT